PTIPSPHHHPIACPDSREATSGVGCRDERGRCPGIEKRIVSSAGIEGPRRIITDGAPPNNHQVPRPEGVVVESSLGSRSLAGGSPGVAYRFISPSAADRLGGAADNLAPAPNHHQTSGPDSRVAVP